MNTDHRAKTLPDLSGHTILLADDNPTNQWVASEMLNAMGARVDLAADGAEALEMLSAQAYDVLIVDIEMPRVSGLDVIRAVRGSGGPQSRRRIIALTAFPREDLGTAVLAAGADQMMTKPIPSIEALGAAVLGTTHMAQPPPAFTMTSAHVVPDILSALIDAVGQDQSDELLTKVIQDISDACQTCLRAAPAGDMARMCSASHVLMSVSGTVGAVKLQCMAEHLNNLAHDGLAAEVEFHATALLTEADQVILTLMREKDRN